MAPAAYRMPLHPPTLLPNENMNTIVTIIMISSIITMFSITITIKMIVIITITTFLWRPHVGRAGHERELAGRGHGRQGLHRHLGDARVRKHNQYVK